MTENEYLRLRSEIQERCRKDLDALERVWRLTNRVGPDVPAPKPRPNARRGRVDMLSRWIISRLTDDDPEVEFGVRDIHGRISAEYPEDAKVIRRSSISSALLRMLESGQIEVVSKGTGRRESVYRKAMATPDPYDADFEKSV